MITLRNTDREPHQPQAYAKLKTLCLREKQASLQEAIPDIQSPEHGQGRGRQGHDVPAERCHPDDAAEPEG